MLIDLFPAVLEAWGEDSSEICSLCLAHLKNLLKEAEAVSCKYLLFSFGFETFVLGKPAFQGSNRSVRCVQLDFFFQIPKTMT